MYFPLYLQLILSCDFQYELSDHDPLYIEQFLPLDQTLCINVTVEYATFILNSLGNSTFKAFDRFNKERILDYEEKKKEATAISFGKMTGSLVISNLKEANQSTSSFISLSVISFPQDECEIKIISNDIKNYVYISFDDSKVCFFSGNGLHYRYQFYVASGTIEIRPPKNISEKVLIKRNKNDKSNYFKSSLKNYLFNMKNKKDVLKQINPIDTIDIKNSAFSVFINNSITGEYDTIFDNPKSIFRVDGYSPLIIYKPDPNVTETNNERSYFMLLGANYHRYPNRLNLRFALNEPGLISGDKEGTNYEENYQNFNYGCDPYVYMSDSSGNAQLLDETGRTAQSYYLEILTEIALSLLFFYLILAAVVAYFLSFCCICPCCCCYNFCHKKVCCKLNRKQKYQSFTARNAIDFLQARNSLNDGTFHDSNINENNVDENRDSSAYNENVGQIQNQDDAGDDVVEEEEEVSDNESINNVEDGIELSNINDSTVRGANPQL